MQKGNVTRTISMKPDLDRRLIMQAKAERRAISEVMRFALKRYLASQPTAAPQPMPAPTEEA